MTTASQTSRRLSVSADVGGTFTDVVTMDADTGAVVIAKSPTVAESPVEGIVNALETTDAALDEMERFFHGTTIGINTLLQRRGARVGLLTTEGYRDILQIGRANWPSFRLTWEAPVPLVAADMAEEVRERVRADGSVLTALDEDDVLAKAELLVERGAEAIAVCFLNSYVEPDHERAAGALIQKHFPHVVVCLSHQLTRRYREYPRATTVAGEAYLRPRMQQYFDELVAGLEKRSFAGKLFVTSSDAGVMGVDLARDRALRTLVSGCASGIAGAATVAASGGWKNLVAIDMGGTSFDAAIIRDGQPAMSATAEVAGHEFLMPMLDMATIGAGGGSIASVDAVGSLHVGPRSAGAQPGPVCYGRGGLEPTFTDAALVTGLLPTELLGGRMSLSFEEARAAIDEKVAQPLGLDVPTAAAGIMAVVEAKMAQMLEEMTIGRGLDPRTFTIFAYGGGGPLVAARLADELGISCVVIPQHPGVFSAWGMQTLDAVQEFSRTLITNPRGLSVEELGAPYAEMVTEARAALGEEGFEEADLTLLRFVEMRYESQEHTLLIPFSDSGEATMRAAFDAAHAEAFGFTVAGEAEIVTYRLRAIGPLTKPLGDSAGAGDRAAGAARTREVSERGSTGPVPWTVVDRADVPTEQPLLGPLIIEEPTCTAVVPRGWRVRTDEQGNLVITR